MRTTSSLQFYCRKCKVTKNGLAPIEASLIINGKRTFINLPRKEYPEAFKRAVTQKRDNPIKDYLYEVRNKLNDIQLEMMRAGIPLTSATLKDYFKSGGVKAYTLEDLWNAFLQLQSKRVGVSISEMGHHKYISARNTLYGYIPKETEVSQITPAMMQNVLASLQSRFKESTVSGIMTKIKTVIKFGMDNGKITINPFQGLKYSKGTPSIDYLTEEEIARIVCKETGIERLDKVKDLAVFQIASGLSYADTQALKPEDIHYEPDGTCYIYKERRKTGVPYTSVVFPEGAAILKKYNNQLPSISNQRGNAYLKELQTLCNIDKTLHFHLFRKTYGTRLLNRGVRLETVSKCLGHSSTQITQAAYAKLLKHTIIDEVKMAFK